MKVETTKLALNVDQMAEQLGIGRRQAYMLARSEGFPTVRVGKRMLVPIDALKRWLEEQANQPYQR